MFSNPCHFLPLSPFLLPTLYPFSYLLYFFSLSSFTSPSLPQLFYPSSPLLYTFLSLFSSSVLIFCYRDREVVLVEGYFDVIALHDIGGTFVHSIPPSLLFALTSLCRFICLPSIDFYILPFDFFPLLLYSFLPCFLFDHIITIH